MNKIIISLLATCLLFASCARRTDSVDFSTRVSVELEIPEMVNARSVIGGAESVKNAAASYFGEVSAPQERDRIAEVSFYIFDDEGDFISTSTFAGAESYSLDLPENGDYYIYALCNMSGLAELPEASTQSGLEALTITHRDSYDLLPFAGKTKATISSDDARTVRITLDRLNSAIRLENRDADRISLVKATVSGLPSHGNIFGTSTEAAGVTYDRTARAVIDADGNAVVYSFSVPRERMVDVRIEAEATVSNGADETSAIAPLSFIDRLEAGKQALSFIGYTAGGLKIGSPENWGNTGLYELSGGVRLQVIGGEFFDYKNVKALRASSGGSVFAFTVSATDGAASIYMADGSAASWVTVDDKTVTVSPNTSSEQRECRMVVTVNGKNVGVFYIVQGKYITFGCNSLAIADGRMELIGGSGGTVHTVTFDISDDELDGMEIVPENNGADGITVDINRSAKTMDVHFMDIVDASKVRPDGVSMPVRFVDVNGRVSATLTVVQRPVHITFDPVRQNNVSYGGGTVTATVDTEGYKWRFGTATDSNGDPAEWITCTSPDGEADSGDNMVLDVALSNVTSGRTAYVRVLAGNTLSKPYEIVQVPSYGIKNMTVDKGVWDVASSTLKVYSGSEYYVITFETETAIPEYLDLKVEYRGSFIETGEVERLSDNKFCVEIYCPDSYSTEEEEITEVDILADLNAIGGFTIIKALWPSFTPEKRYVWGGVKDRPELKRVFFRVSDWDIYSFSSDDDRLTVTQVSDNEIEIGYAETLRYDDEEINTYISINLNFIEERFYTRQSPVSFDISEADMLKLSGVGKAATDVDITVNTQAGDESAPWHVVSTSGDWLTTDPAAGGPETNAGGSPLTVKLAANTGGERTGSFVLESLNTTSPTYEVSQEAGYDPYETVNIGGVEWMQYNLDHPFFDNNGNARNGYFATKLPSECADGTPRYDSHGKFYQWGYNVSWYTTGTDASGSYPRSTWQTTSVNKWTYCPCPNGFRLPTKEDFNILESNTTQSRKGGVNQYSYGYYVFTDNSDPNNKLEFLCVGNRNSSDGKLRFNGSAGYYWLSTKEGVFPGYIAMTSSGVGVNGAVGYTGHSIRCVKDN